jgi:hypothetical protein
LDVDPSYFWKEGGEETPKRYDWQLSVDGGYSWIDINDASSGVPSLLCVTRVTADPTSPYRIFFVAQNGSYRIRVHDQDGIWSNNLDYLVYRLYKVSTGTPGTNPLPGTGPDNPTIWGPGCTDVCMRPGSAFTSFPISFSLLGANIAFSIPAPDVAGWLEYFRCSFQHYISWCQEDTQAILAIPTSLQNKEPFGTFLEIENTIINVQKVIASYNTTGGSGQAIGPNTQSLWGPITGGSSSDTTSPDPLLSNLPVTSFWNGGPLNLSVGGDVSATDTDYIDQCTTDYTKYIGNVAYSMCYTLIIIKNLTGFLQKIQWIIDIVAAFMIVSYIMNRWVGAGGPPK